MFDPSFVYKSHIMLQFHKKGKLIAILVGTAVTLHIGNHLLKPFLVKKPKDITGLNKNNDVYKV